MTNPLVRAVNLIAQPAREWTRIERERGSFYRMLIGYLVPLALIAPIAHASRLFTGAGDTLPSFACSGAVCRLALASIVAGFSTQLLGVFVTAAVIYLLMPLYRGARNYAAAVRLVAYAATPVWLAGIVLAAPLQRFSLLTVAILVALMHASYLFYLGLHHIVKVPLRDAAECAAVVVFASLALSTAVGYFAGALFPQM